MNPKIWRHILDAIENSAFHLDTRFRVSPADIVKVHPQAGHDILKGIDFLSGPIVRMLQHHERLDGSAYPQGLRGEEILLGAGILSVADVVEAMFSHRPYRPGLGVEAAQGEIVRARGVHFDPQVVDACVVLLREQGYVLSN